MELNLGTAPMSDDEVLRAFDATQLNPAKFHHADHIRLAWLCIRRYGAVQAEARLLDGIRKLAQRAGAPGKFLHTTTVVWVRLVAAAYREANPCDSFYEWINSHPHLLNRHLLEEHYSAGKLESREARCGWLDPDLKSLD